MQKENHLCNYEFIQEDLSNDYLTDLGNDLITSSLKLKR